MASVPIIDISPIVTNNGDRLAVGRQINDACRQSGFFYIIGHGINMELLHRLEQLSREFFALPIPEKEKIAMSKGGRAWRGYFRVGNELTSGKPDQKEGVYFGQELAEDHPLVVANLPLHGPNLFPDRPAGLRETVLEYMNALITLGQHLMSGIALAIGIDEDYFLKRGTTDPLTLFRIFNYPPTSEEADLWGVGEHTDYGLLTILLQDEVGGLEVKTREGWIAAPPIKGSFVCNIGDMLDRMTRGVYRSTPHRVRNSSQHNRLSFPFFFDPNFRAPVRPIEMPGGESAEDDQDSRWDRSSVHIFKGTYGEYLLSKVGKVFPELKSQVL